MVRGPLWPYKDFYPKCSVVRPGPTKVTERQTFPDHTCGPIITYLLPAMQTCTGNVMYKV